ncbi:MAG TPA: hypothetical protein VGP68_10200, partial [Gemmataceae bacterium]|nr:hypothetical protein [Gemmataceae bacterium]
VAASKYLWPFVLFHSLLLALHLKHFSLVGAWRSFQLLPASTAMILCLTPPYAAIQAAAMMKDGGGAYNMDLAVMMATPLVILAAKLCGLESWQVVVLFAAVATAGLSRSALESRREIPEGSRLVEDSRSYLEAKYPKAVVLYSADQYCLIGKTSLRPTTDMLTVWHYLMAGQRLEQVKEAVESQRYDLLIYPGLLGNSLPIAEFDRLLKEKYVPLVDDEIPTYLRGGLFVRRPSPH